MINSYDKGKLCISFMTVIIAIIIIYMNYLVIQDIVSYKLLFLLIAVNQDANISSLML